ncbi:MAG: hypothetical protein OEW75_16400, partial [Cyclobacteriaceae bacterium]|nr:hypothetical protein [Cyclobacteriaceae bacterium]
YPNKEEGLITSIVIKEMLTLVGDGQSSLLELILKNDRAYLQLKRIITEGKFDLNFIPEEDEKIVLNTIGNHCLGTIFLNGEKLNSEEMRKSFDRLSKNIEGFFYGRFDVRAATLADIEKGNVKIMELNGVNSEPAHIYQPGYSFLKGQKSLLFHWKTLYEISKINRKNGYKLIGIGEGIKEVRRIFKFNKTYKIR